MKMDEIETRLNQIAEECQQDGADLDALENEAKELRTQREQIKADAEIRKAQIQEMIEEPTEIRNFKEKDKMEKVYTVDSPEYRSAWLKSLAKQELNAEERAAMDSTTASVGYAIPTETANKIVETMKQLVPLLGEIDLMRFPEYVRIAVEGTVNGAALHTENASITPASDTLGQISLTGYEIVKLLSISAKVEKMAIPDFEAWLVRNLSKSIAETIENYIVNGTGSSEPKGIDYADTWADGTNAVDWASSAPTVGELIEQVSYLNGAYARNAKWLMNWKTFWNDIYALRDDKNPGLVARDGEEFRLLGYPVLLSSKVTDGDVFFGDFFEGVKANMAQDVLVESDRSSGFRSNSIDYRGSCLFDCAALAGRIVKGAATL